jgi:hypothetical protein
VAADAIAETHEIWVWPAEEFLKINEFLKSHLDADVVALAQLIASSTKSAQQIRLLGIMGRAYIKTSKKGTKLIVFKGYAGLRPNLQGTVYTASNPKVAAFVVGTKDILEDAAKATKIAIIAFVAIDIIQEFQEDSFSLASLGVRILSDALQAVVAAYAGAAVGVVLTTVGAPTVVAFVVVVLVGFAVGVALVELDRRFQLTEMARARMMAYEQTLKEDLSTVQKRVQEIEQAIQQGKQVVQGAAEIYFAVDRIWRTIDEYLKQGFIIR